MSGSDVILEKIVVLLSAFQKNLTAGRGPCPVGMSAR